MLAGWAVRTHTSRLLLEFVCSSSHVVIILSIDFELLDAGWPAGWLGGGGAVREHHWPRLPTS